MRDDRPVEAPAGVAPAFEEAPQPVRYNDLTLADSVRLLALVTSHHGGLIDSILHADRREASMFASHNQFVDIVERLRDAGWIHIGPSDPAAFFPGSDGRTQYDPMQVNWRLNPDVDLNGFAGFKEFLLAQMYARHLDGTFEEVFKSVCMAELRALFFRYTERFGFEAAVWKPAIERGMAEILENVGLGQAKSLAYRQLKRLASLRQGNYREKHILNMIDGAFSRAIDAHVTHGWTCNSFEREPRKEPVITFLLFTLFEEGGPLESIDAWKLLSMKALRRHLNDAIGLQEFADAKYGMVPMEPQPGTSGSLGTPADAASVSDDRFAMLVELIVSERAEAELPGYDPMRAQMLRHLGVEISANSGIDSSIPETPDDPLAPFRWDEWRPPVRTSDEDYFAALWAFHSAKGHGNVPADWPDEDLARWLANEIAASSHPSYDAARRDRLNALGVSLPPIA